MDIHRIFKISQNFVLPLRLWHIQKDVSEVAEDLKIITPNPESADGDMKALFKNFLWKW